MSSHHFVKEQQEPALLILDTQSTSYAAIAATLEWVPTIVVAQEAVETVLSWGVKIDFILAHQEFQQEHQELLAAHHPLQFLTVDGSVLEKGLSHLTQTEHKAVNIVGFPHQQIFELEPYLEKLDLVVWDGAMRFVPAKSGKFKKWYSDTTLQLHAPDGTWIELTHQEERQLIQVVYATMVEVEEGITSFTSNRMFWIGELIPLQD